MPTTRIRIRSVLLAPTLLVGGLVVAATLYTVLVVLPYLSTPRISMSPIEERPPGIVQISGAVERVSKLTLNGFEIPTTETGTFSVERAYPPGYTVVVLEASDRFGRTLTQTVTFITHSSPYGGEKTNKSENEDRTGGTEILEN